MRDDEIENTIRLIQTPHIGPITFTLLLARYKTATQAVKAAPALAERRGRKLHIASRDIAQKIIADADKAQARILIKGDKITLKPSPILMMRLRCYLPKGISLYCKKTFWLLWARVMPQPMR